MRLSPCLNALAIVAVCTEFAWPGTSAGAPDSSASGPGIALERALPKDPFREFLQENRSREDSLHYRQGELAFGREDFVLALSHHLAADLPAAGPFRHDLLAQRSLIFARVWPTASPRLPHTEADPEGPQDPARPSFDWGAGAEHSRGADRTGPLSPFAEGGFAEESRDWRYRTYARRAWPLSLGKHGMILGLSANADRSGLGKASAYEASFDADFSEGSLAGALLSFSAGYGMGRDWGPHRYYGFMASKSWYSEASGADFEAGYSRQWEGGWEMLGDNAWAKAGRDIAMAGGNAVRASLGFSATRQESRPDRYLVPVAFVDDAARARSSPFPVSGNGAQEAIAGPASLAGTPVPAGEMALTLEAPQSFFSISPSVGYAFAPAAGLRAEVTARYALDVYPEYAWDRVPWPDSMDVQEGNWAGLVLSGADGRYYPALLAERDGQYRQAIGSAPLEHHEAQRLDSRIGLDLTLGKDFPRGYTLSAESSVDFGWTSLARTAPAAVRPWRWGLALNVARSLGGY